MRGTGWIILCIVLFLLSPLISVTHFAENPVEELLRDAHLEEIDGIKVLFTNGSFYELGFQHGYLLKEEVRENVRAFISYGKETASYEKPSRNVEYRKSVYTRRLSLRVTGHRGWRQRFSRRAGSIIYDCSFHRPRLFQLCGVG